MASPLSRKQKYESKALQQSRKKCHVKASREHIQVATALFSRFHSWHPGRGLQQKRHPLGATFDDVDLLRQRQGSKPNCAVRTASKMRGRKEEGEGTWEGGQRSHTGSANRNC